MCLHVLATCYQMCHLRVVLAHSEGSNDKFTFLLPSSKLEMISIFFLLYELHFKPKLSMLGALSQNYQHKSYICLSTLKQIFREVLFRSITIFTHELSHLVSTSNLAFYKGRQSTQIFQKLYKPYHFTYFTKIVD